MAPSTKTLVVFAAVLAIGDLSVAFMPTPSTCPRAQRVVMRAEGPTSRREALGSLGLGVVGLLGLVTSTPARAGWLNSDSLPEVIKPEKAEIDKAVLASDDIQAGIKSLRNYKETIKTLKSSLASNPQADLRSLVNKDFDFAELRDSLNKVNNAVFSEETQRGTDRLVRIILQDVNELEQASRIKPGSQRSENKIVLLNKKLTKLDKAFADLLAFF